MAEADDLEHSSREQLILKARVLGVERAELMTRVELRDEIVRRTTTDPAQQKRARGFLGVARDLVASVVEAGLNLPDAAALIRGEGSREQDWRGPPPVATVTLAEIYAAQGHLERALKMLDEVIAKEPDHDPARALRERLAAGEVAAPAKRTRLKISFVEREPESTEPDPDSDLEAEIPEPAPLEPEPLAETAHASEPVPPVPPVPPEVEPPTPPVPPVPPEVEPPAPPEVEPPTPPAPPEVEPPTPPAPPEVEPPAPPEIEPPPSVEASAERAPAPVPAPPAEPCLLTLAVSGRRQLYWELPASALAALQAHSPEGRAVLRVVTFRARGGKVERALLDIAPHAEIGSSTLPGLSSAAIVRAAFGWETAGQFKPFLLAAELGGEPRAGAETSSFRPHPLVGAVPQHVESRAFEYVARHG